MKTARIFPVIIRPRSFGFDKCRQELKQFLQCGQENAGVP